MSDIKLHVEMSLVGPDGVTREKELHVNWDSERLRDVIDMLIALAEESQVQTIYPCDI